MKRPPWKPKTNLVVKIKLLIFMSLYIVLPFQSTAQKDSLDYWFPTDINEIDSVQAQLDKQIIWNNFFPYMKYPTSLIIDTIESTLYIPRVNSLAECGNNFLQLGFFKYKSLKIKESTAIELLSKECVSLRMDHYCLYKDLNSQSKNMADNCLQEQFSMQRIERKLYKKVQNKIRFEKEGPLKNYKGELEKIEGVFIVAHFFNVPKEVCITIESTESGSDLKASNFIANNFLEIISFEPRKKSKNR